jgi:hypothetical protein
MKPAFPILLLVTLLVVASGAQAARIGAIGSNPMLPPPSPITPLPQTNPGLLSPGAFGAQSPGALPGNPGSPTYNPFGALPSLNNPGTSSFAPLGGTTGALPGTTTTGINTPGLITPGTTGPASGGM